MRRMEHMSSKASSPRNNDEDYEDIKKLSGRDDLNDNCNTEGS